MNTTSSIRDLLKKATQLEHSAAEHRLFGTDFMVGPQEYSYFLKAMLSVHTVYGLSSADALRSETDQIRELELINALRRDLDMKGTFEPDDLSATTMSRSFATGARYAISGSSIGSTKMLKQLEGISSVRNEYLTLSANYCKSELKNFFDKLNLSVADPQEAIVGAKSVFKLVEKTVHAEMNLQPGKEYSEEFGKHQNDQIACRT